MIVIITTFLLLISIISFAFIGFIPNFYRVVHKDFMRKAYGNYLLTGTKRAQLGVRAKTFPDDEPETYDFGYLNKYDDDELDKMSASVELTDDDQLQVDITQEQDEGDD